MSFDTRLNVSLVRPAGGEGFPRMPIVGDSFAPDR